jgi:hypothetical protein
LKLQTHFPVCEIKNISELYNHLSSLCVIFCFVNYCLKTFITNFRLARLKSVEHKN